MSANFLLCNRSLSIKHSSHSFSGFCCWQQIKKYFFIKSREPIAECMQLLFVSQLSVLLTNEDSFIQKISASLFICNKNVCLMCVLFANVLRML